VQRKTVGSSTIASIGYDAATRTLEVSFHSGSVYRYSGVPASVHSGLMSAASHGSYFDSFVKKAGYPYHRVG
jgi:hypothetical protein